jgi:Ohr subfamily peroxiredoxin
MDTTYVHRGIVMPQIHLISMVLAGLTVRASGVLKPKRKEMKMSKLEKVLYTARVHTTGGRDGGTSRANDGRLDIILSAPTASNEGTNPEQLFAAGWSACFLSALKLVAAKRRISLPLDVTVDAEVDLGISQGVHQLAARLNVGLPGVDEGTARSLVEAASHICPYSLATRGNIEVHYSLITSGRAEEVQHA